MVAREVEDLEAALARLGEVPPGFFGDPVGGLLSVALEVSRALANRSLTAEERAAIYTRVLTRSVPASPSTLLRAVTGRTALVGGAALLGLAAVGAAAVVAGRRHHHPRPLSAAA